MWPPKKTTRTSKEEHGIKEGYRSGLEEVIGESLTLQGVRFDFEKLIIVFSVPARKSKYKPDFHLLDNGIIVETKGRFVTKDRQKHLLIKEQHPHLDIRFVFSRSKATISKTSKTTYAMWCDKHGFKYADKVIPDAWLREKKK